MKKIFTLVLALSLISVGAVKAQSISANPNQNLVPTIIKPESNSKALTMITQSTTQTIVTGNSVSCNTAGIHADNSYYRAFDLAGSFSISTIWYVYKVDVAIEQASGTAATEPIWIRLYSATSTNLTTATLTLIQEQQFDVDNSTAAAVVPFTFTTPVEIPAGTILAVEFFTPDGTAGNNGLFIGSNTDTENSPSYMKSADCSINVPTTTTAIGFPDMHIVINVWGDISVGVNNIDAKQINIYPTPTKGIVNIENVSNANIYFTDVLGNVIATKENVTGNTSFDLSNNAKGVYMVKIVTDNKIITKKIVNN
jgi:hypothetical protein